ncbi:MAG TPA: barstar family protein [Burkholderiales bacterium]|nr:barstar family protein [Burkholderiales bacterium]
MGKLLQRLKDPARSGVYRAARADEIVEATRGSGLKVVRIAGSEKIDLLENIAKALAFPDWFGHNWDALEDCLTDLSWNEAAGYVLIFENARNDVMTDVLASAAEFWAGRGKPFFAVFTDPQRELSLPDLFREA